MKRLLAFLALIGTIGHDKTMRATLASGLAIVLCLAVGVPTAWADANGQCPAYNAASVDENFLEWSVATGFDASSGTINCIDLAGNPTILFRANVDGDTYFFVQVTPSPVDPTLHAAWGVSSYSFDDVEEWSNMEDLPDWAVLSVPQSYACRAEILRSSTWRQYCHGATTR